MPHNGNTPPDLKEMTREMKRLASTVDKLNDALLGNYDGKQGLIFTISQLVKEAEESRAELEERIDKIDARISALEIMKERMVGFAIALSTGGGALGSFLFRLFS